MCLCVKSVMDILEQLFQSLALFPSTGSIHFHGDSTLWLLNQWFSVQVLEELDKFTVLAIWDLGLFWRCSQSKGLLPKDCAALLEKYQRSGDVVETQGMGGSHGCGGFRVNDSP